MKPHIYFYLLVMMSISICCKKDKLDKEYEIFLGKWEWAYSKYEFDKCQQSGGFEIFLNPLTENVTYQIEFFEKGKVIFYKNNVEQGRFRVVVSYFEPWTGNQPFSEISIQFNIRLNNNEDMTFNGLISDDSLFTFDRPYKGNLPSCDDYYSYWGQ